MSEITLKVDKRTEFKKSTSNQMRKAGFIPGIYYIHGGENIAIKANELALRPVVFTSESKIINLEIEGESKPYSCILKNVQFDPITTRIIHFDLIGLKEGEKINLEVTVSLNGNPVGVKEGGLVQFILHKLNVSCMPKDIPSHIDLDVTNLNIGDSIKVSDIKIDNVEILNEESQVIVQVVPPVAEEVVETPAVEGEAPAEPEVITKGKKEEESE
ncbi:MAG: 50S ribosomal protein L25 [Ignavibacteria bacterium]|nr:50S ribosomal protein L25 [Ignavibacteria bacterium]